MAGVRRERPELLACLAVERVEATLDGGENDCFGEHEVGHRGRASGSNAAEARASRGELVMPAWTDKLAVVDGCGSASIRVVDQTCGGIDRGRSCDGRHAGEGVEEDGDECPYDELEEEDAVVSFGCSGRLARSHGCDGGVVDGSRALARSWKVEELHGGWRRQGRWPRQEMERS